MKSFLTIDERATLNAIRDRLQANRPEPKTAERHLHDALEDGLGAVIATGSGVMSTERDFLDASKSVRKAIMAS